MLKAFDSTARKSSSGRSYVTTCHDINRYLSRSSADFKVCFDSTNGSTDEIDFCDFVRRLRKGNSKSFVRAASVSSDSLTIFRSVILRVEYDAACDEDDSTGFAKIETLLETFRASSEIHLFLNVQDFETRLLRRCGTRRRYCCFEEILETASRCQICT